MSFDRSGATTADISSASVDTAELSDGEDPSASMSAKATTTKKKKKKKSKSLIPSLRSLVGEQGAVAAMLKSILTFLEMRFPALAFLTGTNVLMSLSVFILLFVFWYCHKRGKETRLQRMTSASFPSPPNPIATEKEKQNQSVYPSLADLESGAVFEREEELVRSQREEALGKREGVAEGTMEGRREDEGREADRKVEELVREAEGRT